MAVSIGSEGGPSLRVPGPRPVSGGQCALQAGLSAACLGCDGQRRWRDLLCLTRAPPLWPCIFKFSETTCTYPSGSTPAFPGQRGLGVQVGDVATLVLPPGHAHHVDGCSLGH